MWCESWRFGEQSAVVSRSSKLQRPVVQSSAGACGYACALRVSYSCRPGADMERLPGGELAWDAGAVGGARWVVECGRSCAGGAAADAGTRAATASNPLGSDRARACAAEHAPCAAEHAAPCARGPCVRGPCARAGGARTRAGGTRATSLRVAIGAVPGSAASSTVTCVAARQQSGAAAG